MKPGEKLSDFLARKGIELEEERVLSSILGEENAEFETMIPLEKGDISFRFKIKDTEENRENLKKALSKFYGPAADDLDELKINVEDISKDFIDLEITFSVRKGVLLFKIGNWHDRNEEFYKHDFLQKPETETQTFL